MALPYPASTSIVAEDGPPRGRWSLSALAAIILLAVAIRAAAAIVLDQPLEDDARSYFLMAQGFVDQGSWQDAFGQHAFFSAGYPLLLVPFFALFGSSVAAALVANLLLAALGTWLVHAIAWEIARRQDAAWLAAFGYALWIPGIWNATSLAKENLSTPLLLALALCALRIAGGGRLLAASLAAGLLWGANLVTGGASLLLCAGIAVALLLRWRVDGAIAGPIKAGLCFLAGALVILAPWLYATDRMVGKPVLTTNAAFNLYLGNNPAANGRFVSIAETPLGPEWRRLRAELGELELAERLRSEAFEWVAGNPGRAAQLGLRKLALFWLPNVPDAADFSASRSRSVLRFVEVLQYLAILLLGLWAFRSTAIARERRWPLAAMILGFWLVHALAYIIMRYRDPVMPLLIAMAATQAAIVLARLQGDGRAAHAA